MPLRPDLTMDEVVKVIVDQSTADYREEGREAGDYSRAQTYRMAQSNTGYFILKSLGLTRPEILALYEEEKKRSHSTAP
jgi:hypothetical protein